jgi:hypoxanthine phosphoribosyltransferase
MTRTLPAAIAEIVFDEATIAASIADLAKRVVADSGDAPIVLVGVLKGALFVTADLARALPPQTEAKIDFLAVSSYGNATRSSGEVRLLKDTTESVEGKHVLIVEDIVDNGLTLSYLQRLLGSRNPASLRSLVLLDKPYHRRVDVTVDYVGLTAPDAFIVGYGLDYQEKYRNLPYLARLHSWACE